MDMRLDFSRSITAFTGRLTQFLAQTPAETDTIVRTETEDLLGYLRRTAAVDTGAYRASWGSPEARGPQAYAVTNTQPYAVVLEYGGYRGVGPRTVRLGARDLGEGFVAGSGIYSTQEPHGHVRKGLVRTKPRLLRRLAAGHQRRWGTL